MKIKIPQVSAISKNFLKIIKALIMYTSVFILFFSDSAFYPVNNMSGTFRILVNIVAVIGLAISSGMVLKIKKRLLLVYGILCTIVLISGICYSNIKQTLIVIVCITVGFAVANFLDYNRFKKIYKDMMLFLAVFSLITFSLWHIFPSVITALPIVKTTTSNYHSAIFSIISTSTYSTRNYGMFWEPGAFAIFLNIALLFEMTDKRQSLLKILIFIITIVSTMSTLGIACLAILIGVYVFNNDKGIRNYKRNRLILILISLAAVIYVFYYGEDFIYRVFGKLSPTSNGKINVSTETRINAIIYPSMAFIESPFTGVGFNEFSRISKEYCSSMATCTFINWLAIYGILGLIFIVGCISVFLKHGNSVISKIGMLIFAILLFSTETFLLIGFIYIFVFYGTQKNLSQKFVDS